VHHDWLTPPEGLLWGDTHGLAQDSSGRIYVAHTVHHTSSRSEAVVVFDREGQYLSAFGAEFRGGAHGLDLRREGAEEYLYHCDTQRRLLVKSKLDGDVVWQASFPKESGKYESEGRYCPTNVAFAPDGDLFVGDGYGSSFVHRYSSSGQYRSTIGEPGARAGELACPHGLWLDERGEEPLLAVADRGNRRIQYFSLDGKHVSFVTDGMRQPCHFKVRDGVMLVPDLSSVVTLLDEQNKVITQLGDGHPTSLRDRPRTEFVPGKFIHPHTAIFLDTGDILVAEWVPVGRITLLKRHREGA